MKLKHINIVITVCILIFSISLMAQEKHVDSIITGILNTRDALISEYDQYPENLIFLTFWDFDGTILKGDCSEGLYEGEEQIYTGLAQLAIESGYSNIYPAQGFMQFWDDYINMGHNIGKWLAYPYIPQMLRGAKSNDIHNLSRRHFNNVLKNYYFNSSLNILKLLANNNIRNFVISASADVFIDAAASTLGMNTDRFHGIEVEIFNNRLTEKLVYPVTWAEGKTEKMISIAEETADNNPGKKVFVLAAFGNSYSTDGPFMKYVAEQNLPAGDPVSVMINGGVTPEEYSNLFIKVEQSDIQNP